jgi:Bacteriophage Lambda NinG protein
MSVLSDLETKAQNEFNTFIKKRDANVPCIYCLKPVFENSNAAHFFTKNRFSGYMFNEDNCHKSHDFCNNLDDQNAYRENLIKRIGLERVEILEENANQNRFYKFDRFELIEIANKYKLKIKELNE